MGSKLGSVILDAGDVLKMYAEIHGRANQRLNKMGVPIMHRPKADVPVVERVSDLTDTELGDVQAAFAAWESYLAPLAAEAESRAIALKNRRDYLFARLKRDMTGSQANKEERARTDGRFVQADAQYLEAKEVAKKIRATLESIETQRKVCSRYVELRKIEVDSVRRTENVQHTRPARFRG